MIPEISYNDKMIQVPTGIFPHKESECDIAMVVFLGYTGMHVGYKLFGITFYWGMHAIELHLSYPIDKLNSIELSFRWYNYNAVGGC